MTDTPEVAGTPLVLLVNDEEWTARSLKSILEPNGYAVLLAYTGEQALDLAEKVTPDVFFVDLGLPDMDGEEVARRLRQTRSARPSTPFVFVSSSAVDRERRLACLRAGAWHVLQPPFDPDEFLVRLRTFVDAKQDVDRALEQTHLDPVTGFYNVQGLMRRVGEIAADATRTRRSVACVVLGPSRPDRTVELSGLPEDATERLANVLLSTTRLSDAIARIGENEFVIVAPGTDPGGATRLAERLLEAMDSSEVVADLPEMLRTLKAGIHVVDEPQRQPIVPEALLRRAQLALRQAQGEENGRMRMKEEDGDGA